MQRQWINILMCMLSESDFGCCCCQLLGFCWWWWCCSSSIRIREDKLINIYKLDSLYSFEFSWREKMKKTYLYFILVIIVIHLNVLFSQCRSTGLPAIEMITFWFAHDDVGVECAVLCAAQPTLEKIQVGSVLCCIVYNTDTQ